MPESSVLFDASRGRIDVLDLPDGGVVISLRGDHDLSTKLQVVEALSPRRRVPWTVIVIDLRQCTFVDSTIIGTILAVGRRGVSPEPRVSVVLPADTSYVSRAFSVMGLQALLPVHLSVEAALAETVDPAQPREAGGGSDRD